MRTKKTEKEKRRKGRVALRGQNVFCSMIRNGDIRLRQISANATLQRNDGLLAIGLLPTLGRGNVDTHGLYLYSSSFGKSVKGSNGRTVSVADETTSAERKDVEQCPKRRTSICREDRQRRTATWGRVSGIEGHLEFGWRVLALFYIWPSNSELLESRDEISCLACMIGQHDVSISTTFPTTGIVLAVILVCSAGQCVLSLD